VARLAPEGKVSLATGGAQVYLFGGAVVGPPLFGLLASAGGFALAYLWLAVPAIAAGSLLLRAPTDPGTASPVLSVEHARPRL
jgi:hypothetical protein